jgi:hypothetical protein
LVSREALRAAARIAIFALEDSAREPEFGRLLGLAFSFPFDETALELRMRLVSLFCGVITGAPNMLHPRQQMLSQSFYTL